MRNTMFGKTFSEALALLGLRSETIPEPEPEEAPCIDIGCLDLHDPCQAFDALRRAVSIAHAQQAQARAAGRFDLAA
jgi:hypothetical protein